MPWMRNDRPHIPDQGQVTAMSYPYKNEPLPTSARLENMAAPANEVSDNPSMQIP